MLSPRDQHHLDIVFSQRLKHVADMPLNDGGVPTHAYLVLLKPLQNILVPEVFRVASQKVYGFYPVKILILLIKVIPLLPTCSKI